jgi:hypothetical protein
MKELAYTKKEEAKSIWLDDDRIGIGMTYAG